MPSGCKFGLYARGTGGVQLPWSPEISQTKNYLRCSIANAGLLLSLVDLLAPSGVTAINNSYTSFENESIYPKHLILTKQSIVAVMSRTRLNSHGLWYHHRLKSTKTGT